MHLFTCELAEPNRNHHSFNMYVIYIQGVARLCARTVCKSVSPERNRCFHISAVMFRTHDNLLLNCYFFIEMDWSYRICHDDLSRSFCLGLLSRTTSSDVRQRITLITEIFQNKKCERLKEHPVRTISVLFYFNTILIVFHQCTEWVEMWTRRESK